MCGSPSLPYASVLPQPPSDTPFPYTTLFRSVDGARQIACISRTTDPSGLARDDVVAQRSDVGGSLSRSEEHTSELQSPYDVVCRLLLAKMDTNGHADVGHDFTAEIGRELALF